MRAFASPASVKGAGISTNLGQANLDVAAME